MAGRKASDDGAARLNVADRIEQVMNDSTDAAGDDEVAGRATSAVMRMFPYVQYETATTKLAGEEVTRRVVLTGKWEPLN